MDKLLTNFIRALRNAEVRVSPAETLDAMRTVQLVGYRDRALLKHSLGLVLPKTSEEKAVYDVCFEKFFTVLDAANVGADHAIPSEDIDAPNDSLDNDLASGDPGEDEGEGEGESAGDGANAGSANGGASKRRQTEVEDRAREHESLPESQSALGKMLMRGDRLEIGSAIAIAGQEVNVQNIEVFTQKSVYTRKIMNAMGLVELTEELERLQRSGELASRRLGNELTRRRDWLRERIRDYVEHQFLLHADVTGKRLQEDLLRTIRLSNADHRHLRRMQEMVMRMAKRLASLYSHRRRVFRRGQLHVPRTLRRNVSYDGALFNLQWRSEKIDRPKVFAICDVSGSVAEYAKFMLMLLYSLKEVLPNVRSFAFSAELAEVSTLFEQYGMEEAIARILNRYGGSTDYGHAFTDFETLALRDVDKRTTIIVLGDARNNYGDLRSDVLKSMYLRCKRLIWLNPEPRSSWDVGDSEMKHYAAYCHQVDECNSLLHLERVIGRLLRSTS